MTYFVLGGGHLLPAVRDTGCTVCGLDWRTPIHEAREVLGEKVSAVQGNLDPTVLFGGEAVIRAEVRRVGSEGRGGGPIFNLGHGILKTTPISAVEIMLDEIRGSAK